MHLPLNPFLEKRYKFMLKILKSVSQLNIEELLAIYQEDILENGISFFPQLSGTELIRKSEDSFVSYLREDFFSQKDSFVAVWTSDGHYKAALRIEPYNDGVLLEALSTAPSERKKGFGYLLVSAVQGYLSDLSYNVIYSHINKKNIPSLELHKKCGFQIFADFARYIDGTVTQNSCTMYYQLKK